MFTVKLAKITNIFNNGIEFHKPYRFDNVTMEATRRTVKDGVEYITVEFVLDRQAFTVDIKDRATANEIVTAISDKIRKMAEETRQKIEFLNSKLSEMSQFSIEI